MDCSVCGRQAKNGYFEDRDSEMVFICKGCLMKYQYGENRKDKYDHKQIYDWYLKGVRKKTIADYLGTNTLVVARAIEEQRRLEGD